MKQETQATIHPLAQFAAQLQWSDVPEPVQRRAEDLWVDWFGSVLAGCKARPVASITRFALSQGPAQGPSEVIAHGATSSPMMAALANAAASHFAEQDDVHNGSVFHPAAVVFPPALAVAQSIGASGAELMAACVAGYEVGIRVGEFLGRSHYKIFHTTATAGTLAAAAAVGRLLELTPAQMQHAFGSAGTQSAGLWEFLRTAADSKQLHTAHAASAGLMAAYLAQDGFTGAQDIFTGPQGLAAGMSTDANPAKLTDGLGQRWATAETSFKWHASCRHTHPAADALLQVMRQHGLQTADIAQVTCAMSAGARPCSRITSCSASAAGCVWRHEACHLNDVSAVAQRLPRPSVSLAGLASLDMPAARPCGPVKMSCAPVKPSLARYAAISPAAEACAVCSCLLSAAVRKNSHRPADCVPAEPKACCICAGVRCSKRPTAAAAASVPAVAVVWNTL